MPSAGAGAVALVLSASGVPILAWPVLFFAVVLGAMLNGGLMACDYAPKGSEEPVLLLLTMAGLVVGVMVVGIFAAVGAAVGLPMIP